MTTLSDKAEKLRTQFGMEVGLPVSEVVTVAVVKGSGAGHRAITPPHALVRGAPTSLEPTDKGFPGDLTRGRSLACTTLGTAPSSESVDLVAATDPGGGIARQPLRAWCESSGSPGRPAYTPAEHRTF